VRIARNCQERAAEEDRDLAKMQAMWAQGRGRAKSEMKRRAESARIVTKKIGIAFKPQETPSSNLENVISFENVAPAEVGSKDTRPSTAYNSDRRKYREELIQNAFLSGKLKGHVGGYAENLSKRETNNLAVVGVKPKKKTF
jgi:hypothetical protein